MKESKKDSRTATEIARNIREFFFISEVSEAFNTTELSGIFVAPSKKALKDTLISGETWLFDILHPAILKYQAIRKLHSQDVWDNFEALFVGDEGTSDNEAYQVMLERKNNLLEVWRKRPAILRKTKTME